jgi:ornithine carbamoyltransferase
LIGAFLFHYWRDVLFYAAGVFALGVSADYAKWRDRETSFQEALMDTLNTISSRLEAIETALKERDSELNSE